MNRKLVADLKEGELFSLDGVAWYECVVVLFGTVSVRVPDPAYVVRIDADPDVLVWVRDPAAELLAERAVTP